MEFIRMQGWRWDQGRGAGIPSWNSGIAAPSLPLPGERVWELLPKWHLLNSPVAAAEDQPHIPTFWEGASLDPSGLHFHTIGQAGKWFLSLNSIPALWSPQSSGH